MSENAVVFAKDGEVRASSVDIAAAFEKAHKHVLEAIDMMIDSAPEARPNFRPCAYRGGNGRDYRMFEMTRDGFSLLAMGFTGAKALKWKLAFIEAFNRMEAALSAPLPVPANDAAIPAPNLGTADERDSIRVAVMLVRQMQAMQGRQAALALWTKLGLPEPEMQPAIEHAPEEDDRPVATIWQWATARGVQIDVTAETQKLDLWSDYSCWASQQGLQFMEPPRFNLRMRDFFGVEGKRRFFPIVVTGGDLRPH